MTRKCRLLISVAAALLLLTALTIHSRTVTAAVSNARPAADPASEGCAGTVDQSAPAYQHPDWWLGAIEYGFP